MPPWTNWQSRFSQKEEFSPFDSEVGYQISTSELTLATEEVRDLWQVRVGEIYFGICLKFTLVFR